MVGRHGSVMYLRDLALSLQRRGQAPALYSPALGDVAEELRQAGVVVVDRLEKLTVAPDVIVGNSNTDIMEALLHFPGVPGVFVCHSWDLWLCIPPRFPRLRQYVAVDETCREWLVEKNGAPPGLVRVMYNPVDLQRFAPRAPLPARPTRAAVFSNYTNEANGLGLIREACRRAGIAVDVIGEANGQPEPHPEKLLGNYDLIFGKARCALEAMATGCAMIVCDYGRLGGLVTTQNWRELRQCNFAHGAIQHPMTLESLQAELARYNAADAMEVARQLRAIVGLNEATRAWVELAAGVISEQQASAPSDLNAELRAAAAHLREMNLFQEKLRLHRILDEHATALARSRQENEAWRRERRSSRRLATRLLGNLFSLR